MTGADDVMIEEDVDIVCSSVVLVVVIVVVSDSTAAEVFIEEQG